MIFTPAHSADALRSVYQPPIGGGLDDAEGEYLVGDVVVKRQFSDPAKTWRLEQAKRHVTYSLASVAVRSVNWDGYESSAPNPRSIERAVSVIGLFLLEAVERRPEDPLFAPFVGLNEHGDVVFEWWNEEKKLSLYVGPDTTEYVSSWGPHIEDQMDAGTAEPGRFGDLWTWLSLKSV